MPRIVKVTQEDIKEHAKHYWERTISLALNDVLTDDLNIFSYNKLKCQRVKNLVFCRQIKYYYFPDAIIADDIIFRFTISFECKLKKEMPQPFSVTVFGIPGRISAKKN